MLGVLFERFLMSKVYGSNVLMQLLVCYAVVLISDDLIKIIWGPSVAVDGHAGRVPPAAAALLGRRGAAVLHVHDRGGDGDRPRCCGW